MAGDPTQMYNPNTMGGLSGGGGGPSMPDGPPINGGRPLGIFPGDVQFGLSKGLQGWSGTSVMNGGLFGIFSSNQKGAGFFMRILSSIRDDMLSFAKNDPGPAAFQGAQGLVMGNGAQPAPMDMASMISGIGELHLGTDATHVSSMPVHSNIAAMGGGGHEIG